MDAVISGSVYGTGSASAYTNIVATDVENKIRMAAMRGNYNESDFITLSARDQDGVNMTIDKPAGSDLVTTEWRENWPLTFTMGHKMQYAGKGINYRNFAGNNRDYAGTNFLYNTRFTELTLLGTNVTNTSVIVVASPAGIVSADVLGNRFLNYNSKTTNDGIASLKYQTAGGRLAANGQQFKQNFGDERYVGQFNITRHMQIKIRFINRSTDDDWIKCSCLPMVPSII